MERLVEDKGVSARGNSQGNKVNFVICTVISTAVLLAGCAIQKPKAVVPAAPQIQEPVPGHPGLHFGPEHLECDARNNCELARNWLTADGKQVLSPLGCLLAKARITWVFGDRVSMCEKKF